jgi:uncharacterized protein (DUF885 family)
MQRYLIFLVLCAGCATPTLVEQPLTTATLTASEALQAIGHDYWEEVLHRSPIWATYLGDRRYDDRLPDNSPEAAKAWDETQQFFLLELRRIPRQELSETERITVDVLEFELETSLDVSRQCRGHLWQVDQLSGPQVTLMGIPIGHTVRNRKDADNLLARYSQMGGLFDQHIANLRAGLEAGYVAPRVNVKRVLVQVNDLLGRDVASLSLVAKPREAAVAFNPEWENAAKQVVGSSLIGGLTRYRDFLNDELLPHARAQVGVSEIPNGAKCYEARARRSIGVRRTADELHELGLAEVARIHAEMLTLVREDLDAFIEGETPPATAGPAEADRFHLANFLAELAERDDQHVDTREALVAYNEKLVARAQSTLPQAFGRLPKTPIVVKPLEAYQEKDAPMAYYYSAPQDGSRPATYYINTYQPETRPLYIMAVLAYHEAVPGHHLQVALATENDDLPTFQRELGQTAFVEGWALYAEALSGELGLYETKWEKLGALVFEMWRACRLVVDTGMHVKGWTRDEALQYIRLYTGKHEGEAANEIDRYIAWPGQALAYKVGQLEILAMRKEAEDALGERFSLRGFHDEMLRHGAMPMSTLWTVMRAWINSQN